MTDSGGVVTDASSNASNQPATRAQEEPEPFTRDDAFDLLSNHRRRFTLHLLQEDADSVDLGDLAEQIAAWENGTSIDEISATERKRVYTSLQQFHLPKMDKMDVVEFDDRDGLVALGPAAENLDIYLEVVEEQDIPWSEYYLALGAVSLALFSAVALDVYPLTILPVYAWGVFITTALLVSALVHTYIVKSEMRLGTNEKPPEVKG